MRLYKNWIYCKFTEMSPRRYRADKRQEATAETRRRILDAVIALHAERGALRTTYAMIAERADVAVPTVYNHFPTHGGLLDACIGHTLAQAPPLGPQIFAGAADLESRVGALVRAYFAFYRFLDRWLRWGYYEAQLDPAIGTRLKAAAEGRRNLIALALAPRRSAALGALFDILLDFPAWQRLSQDESLAAGEAEAVLAETLVALARGHGAADSGAPAARRGKPGTRRTAT